MPIAKKNNRIRNNLSAKYFLEMVDKIKLFCIFVNQNIKKALWRYYFHNGLKMQELCKGYPWTTYATK